MATPFGKYALQRKLAEGGMAEIFLARQSGMEGFEKLCVIKRLLPDLSQDAGFVSMFLNEARLAARLNHPNIAQIWDLGRVDEQYFIAMEFVHGEDLRTFLAVAEQRSMRPPVELVCRVIADMLAGLHYAHTRADASGKSIGLVHRDVSPANILITYEGTVKVVDFGIAKATRQATEQTQAGLLKGKFAYMSPEQARGQPIDARSDVFSAGILMWELLTWKRLFRRKNEMMSLRAIADEDIPSAQSVAPLLPHDVNRIVMRALERETDLRYASAQEMRADLEAVIREHKWEADALAVQRFMTTLFADKLKAQADDVRASGASSLDDFLLRIEESTRLSWLDDRPMAAPAPLPQQRTPSAARTAPAVANGALAAATTAPLGLSAVADTARHGAWNPPSRWRRVAVIVSAATVAAAAALAVVFWPRHDDPLPMIPAQPAAAPSTPLIKNKATVVVTTDAPAVISIDGTARTGELTLQATLEIAPGIIHTVGAQRPGHSLHAVKLQPVQPGEEIPVRFKLK